MAFLYHWKDLFNDGRIFIIPSPRYILTKGKGQNRKVIYFYNDEEFEQNRNKYRGFEIRYIKGLGTLRATEYADVLNDESKWIKVTIDDESCFSTMFSPDVAPRKKLMSE